VIIVLGESVVQIVAAAGRTSRHRARINPSSAVKTFAGLRSRW